MSEPVTIPYVETHAGPKRTLYLQLSQSGLVIRPWIPIVGIDGRPYVVTWGLIGFEIPADRAVHLSVHMDGEYMAKAASAIIRPGDSHLEMRYTDGMLQEITRPS